LTAASLSDAPTLSHGPFAMRTRVADVPTLWPCGGAYAGPTDQSVQISKDVGRILDLGQTHLVRLFSRLLSAHRCAVSNVGRWRIGMAAWGCDHAGEKPPFSAKVRAYREQSGKKYFQVFLNDGSRARIDFLEGVTTQQSFVALGRALNEKLGPCSITAMNDLVLFGESDGPSAE
jgi:hypothetical protein